MAKRTVPESIDLESLPLIEEKDMRQFVLQVGEHRARMEYDHQGDRIFLTQTEIPKALDGMPVADALVLKALIFVEEKRWKLIPVSHHVKAYLRAHPEWKRLLVKGLHV
jgi:uncharacterized protein